ncbi:hypothetical protein DPMN_145241 [Dreissena polymorpha]|uniref:Uncharacterized protein n=1 Tax=Dreissena polymorpha TaxID=45954 RepID=A0A9D4IXA9_DREPO|nr:hypothetical protein DPMN_145241 [Dreissena polymorpha]
MTEETYVFLFSLPLIQIDHVVIFVFPYVQELFNFVGAREDATRHFFLSIRFGPSIDSRETSTDCTLSTFGIAGPTTLFVVWIEEVYKNGMLYTSDYQYLIANI